MSTLSCGASIAATELSLIRLRGPSATALRPWLSGLLQKMAEGDEDLGRVIRGWQARNRETLPSNYIGSRLVAGKFRL